MRKFLLALLLLLAPCSLWAQTPSNILAVPEATSAAPTDMMYIVIDPSGTPLDRKIEVGNLIITDHSALVDRDLDASSHPALYTGYQSGSGPPSAGTVPRLGYLYFNTATPTAPIPYFGIAGSGNWFDFRTITDGVTSYCFNADCETVAGYNNTLVFTSSNSSITGTATSAGSSPNKTLTIDLTAAGTVQTLSRFRPANNEPPATLFATYGTRNARPILQFVDGSDTSAVFADIMPRHYLNGNLNVRIGFTSTAASNAIGWCAAFELVGTGGLDIDGNNFATAQCVSQAANANSGVIQVATIPFTQAQADTIAANNFYRLKITRDGDGTTVTDSNTGTGELLFVEVYQ